MRRASARRAREDAEGGSDYPEARKAALWRAGGLCEGCGRRIDLDRMHFHHRKARAHGRDDSPTNALALDFRCHNWAHAHVTEARDLGWIVPSWGDPAHIPVKLRDGVWWLRGNGTREAVAPGAFPLYSGDIDQAHPSERE